LLEYKVPLIVIMWAHVTTTCVFWVLFTGSDVGLEASQPGAARRQNCG